MEQNFNKETQYCLYDYKNFAVMLWNPHQWCNSCHARLECGKSWVKAQIMSNQRL